MKLTISYDQFDCLDIRVGRVTAVEVPTWSPKLLELTIDLGAELGQRTIFAAIQKWFNSADLKNHQYLFLTNIAERKMGEGVSQGMMLMAVTSDQEPILCPVPDAIAPGTVIR